MTTANNQRFPIRFDRWYRVLSRALWLLPSESFIEVGDVDVSVRMGWGFRAAFPRSAVARTTIDGTSVLSRGIHGFAGHWLVNGSGDHLVTIDLQPKQRATVLGVPVKLVRLIVSVDDPEALVQSLS